MQEEKDKRDLSEMRFHMTPEGSLGILAYGDVALQAWRKIKKSKANTQDTTGTKS